MWLCAPGTCQTVNNTNGGTTAAGAERDLANALLAGSGQAIWTHLETSKRVQVLTEVDRQRVFQFFHKY